MKNTTCFAKNMSRFAGLCLAIVLSSASAGYALTFDQLKSMFFENQKKIKTYIAKGSGASKSSLNTADGIKEMSIQSSVEVHAQSPDKIKTTITQADTAVILIQKSRQKSQKVVSSKGTTVSALSGSCDFYTGFFNLGLSENADPNQVVESLATVVENGITLYKVKVNYAVPVSVDCSGATPPVTSRDFFFSDKGLVVRFINYAGTQYKAQNDVTYEQFGEIFAVKSMTTTITVNSQTSTTTMTWNEIQINPVLPDNDFNL